MQEEETVGSEPKLPHHDVQMEEGEAPFVSDDAGGGDSNMRSSFWAFSSLLGVMFQISLESFSGIVHRAGKRETA